MKSSIPTHRAAAVVPTPAVTTHTEIPTPPAAPKKPADKPKEG